MMFQARQFVGLFLIALFTCDIDARPVSVAEIVVLDKQGPTFILAGDSTTAKGGGWGDGFLQILQAPAHGTNLGHGGATTVSFRRGGDWGKVISAVKSAPTRSLALFNETGPLAIKERDVRMEQDEAIEESNGVGSWNTLISKVKRDNGGKAVYVTIQFGHNDQKEKAGISIQAFQKNLENFAQEVRAAGGIPILLTPLTRRVFQNNEVKKSLANERQATIRAAGSNTAWVDLNRESELYINAIGRINAKKYSLKDGDDTHLNGHGASVFGRMVADLIAARLPELAGAFKKDEKLSSAIKKGVPV